jgi:hypothetical protein
MNIRFILCFSVLIISISCEKKIDYCVVFEEKGLIPKKEEIIINDSIKGSFLNYWNLELVTKYYDPPIFRDTSIFRNFYDDALGFSQYRFIESGYEEKRIKGSKFLGHLNIDIIQKIIKDINHKKYILYVFKDDDGIYIDAFKRLNNKVCIKIDKFLYEPYAESTLNENKTEVIEEQLNQLYCVLSTLEVKI